MSELSIHLYITIDKRIDTKARSVSFIVLFNVDKVELVL